MLGNGRLRRSISRHLTSPAESDWIAYGSSGGYRGTHSCIKVITSCSSILILALRPRSSEIVCWKGRRDR